MVLAGAGKARTVLGLVLGCSALGKLRKIEKSGEKYGEKYGEELRKI